MGFNLQMPPEGTVWDYMFDYDKIRCGGIRIKGYSGLLCELQW